MEYIIDFTGFIVPDGEFVIKEVCVTSIGNQVSVNNVQECEHYVCQPPSKYINAMIMHENVDHYGKKHGILWDYGKVKYAIFEKKLKKWIKDARYFYVLGSEKQKWLTDLINDTVPLTDLKKMDPVDIACFDDLFLLRFSKRQIHHIWPKLPSDLQNNKKTIDYKFCTKHYPDGCSDCEMSEIWIYPYQKDCYYCQMNQ
ncbi:hypothetical protein KQX54_001718 [Cotesia glomerata]|uniref:Uncharacterized protein n=1 Tax=Cotesia glomerata TaxID=32391 RepID=A0AAV7HXE8_COTGL|nr:hypothetical protein KQX54_001718 [Cotesia glomerata]